jgi:hypothetical protein
MTESKLELTAAGLGPATAAAMRDMLAIVDRWFEHESLRVVGVDPRGGRHLLAGVGPQPER